MLCTVIMKRKKWGDTTFTVTHVKSPNAHLVPHNNGDLDGGILLNGLQTLVQADKKSNKPIVGCWALPYGDDVYCSCGRC